MSELKAREFIAYKRTKKSSWIYDEYSEQTDRAIDEIAPDGGNFLKLRLIERSAYTKAVDAMKYMRDRWCIKPDCKCMLCETLKDLGCES